MSITTYSELQTAIENWLARSDLTTTRVPEFITLAEAKFNRELSVRQMEQRSTSTIDTTSASPEFISLPTDFRSMRWLRVSSVTGKPHLDYLSPVALDEYRTARGDATGQPTYFTIIGSEIEVAPTPDSDYVLEMVYRKYITALSDSNTTNWLLTLAPDIYLYGSLVEAAKFMRNAERVAVWSSDLQIAIDRLNELNRTAAFNAGPVTVRVSGVTP